MAETRFSGRLVVSFVVALGVLGEFEVDEPFTKLPVVLEDDRRIADEGRDVGLSFLLSAFNASGPEKGHFNSDIDLKILTKKYNNNPYCQQTSTFR